MDPHARRGQVVDLLRGEGAATAEKHANHTRTDRTIPTTSGGQAAEHLPQQWIKLR